ncbi:MAG TPA: hypothetical protein VKF82_07580 [Candidatus Eremiobacteraceae bacterium]|nr:hypothetical protein [Candidatus Eremiobacteraceae bacterium]
MRLVPVLMLAALLAVFPACAKKSQTTTAPGAMAPQTSVQRATVVTTQGKVTMGQGAVDPNSLGLPVYPGATPSEAGSYSMTAPQGSEQILTIETKDPFDKVVAFYKDKMPAGTQSALTGSGSAATAQFAIGKPADKVHKGIIIAQSGGTVKITMMVGTNQ